VLALDVIDGLLIVRSSIVAEMSGLPTTATRTYHGDILYPSNMYRGLIIGAVGAAVTHLWKDADQDELKASYCADIYLRSIMHEAYNNLYPRTASKSYVTAA
jgi:hypothetical protein